MTEQRTDTEASPLVPSTGQGAGGGRRHERVGGGWRHSAAGRRSTVTARREAVLRVLMEAYRRDVGPSALDPR